MDNRRINGPELSRPFTIFAKQPPKIQKNIRPDGRGPMDMRKMCKSLTPQNTFPSLSKRY